MLGLVSEDFAKHIEQLNNQRPGDESVAGPCGSWEAQLGWTPKQKFQILHVRRCPSNSLQ